MRPTRNPLAAVVSAAPPSSGRIWAALYHLEIT